MRGSFFFLDLKLAESPGNGLRPLFCLLFSDAGGDQFQTVDARSARSGLLFSTASARRVFDVVAGQDVTQAQFHL
ncbi:hypothetical protein CCR95_03555 [Thiocystis minor]|nr:hypothetical protein [Thiocystis minor]